MCRRHHMATLYGKRPAVVSDAQRANDRHSAGVKRFGTAWLGVQVEINHALRRTHVFDGEAPDNLHLAACQIAWSWCETLEPTP